VLSAIRERRLIIKFYRHSFVESLSRANGLDCLGGICPLDGCDDEVRVGRLDLVRNLDDNAARLARRISSQYGLLVFTRADAPEGRSQHLEILNYLWKSEASVATAAALLRYMVNSSSRISSSIWLGRGFATGGLTRSR
jgi:hypothetical protein